MGRWRISRRGPAATSWSSETLQAPSLQAVRSWRKCSTSTSSRSNLETPLGGIRSCCARRKTGCSSARAADTPLGHRYSHVEEDGVMRKVLITVAAVSVMAGAGSACATKKFVRGEVDTVNGKVETLSQSLETTQQQTKENAGRITQADPAKKYLYDTYQIPLHKINVISYGEEKPVAPNTTKAGRAQNRRVVIKVLA